MANDYSYSSDKYLDGIFDADLQIQEHDDFTFNACSLTVRRSNIDWLEGEVGGIDIVNANEKILVEPATKAKEITDITCRADVSGDLGGKYFLICQPKFKKIPDSVEDCFEWYYVWYDVDGGSSNPGPSNGKASQKWGFTAAKTESSSTGLGSNYYYATVTYNGTDYPIGVHGSDCSTFQDLIRKLTYDASRRGDDDDCRPVPRTIDVEWDSTGNGFLKFVAKLSGENEEVEISDGYGAKPNDLFAAITDANASPETKVDGTGPWGDSPTGIEVDISSDDGANTVATKTKNAIDGTTGFGATVAANVVTVTCDDYGMCIEGQDVDVGGTFDISRDTEGYDEYLIFSGSVYTGGYIRMSADGLAECEINGGEVSLGTGDGTSGQKFDYFADDYPSFVWVETGLSTGTFAPYLALGEKQLDDSDYGIGAGTELGCFFRWDDANQQIEFGDGTNGNIVASGATLKAPSIHCGPSSFYRDMSDASHKRWYWDSGPTGIWDLEKVNFSGHCYFESSIADSMRLVDVGFVGDMLLTECGDVEIEGLYNGLNTHCTDYVSHESGMVLSWCTFKNGIAKDMKIVGYHYYGLDLDRTYDTEFEDLWCYVMGHYSYGLSMLEMDNCDRLTFTNLVGVGAGFYFNGCDGLVIDGLKFSQHPDGGTPSEGGNMFVLGNCPNGSFDNIQLTENGTPCYGYCISFTDCSGTIFTNWNIDGNNYSNRFLYPHPLADNFAVIGGDIGTMRSYFCVDPGSSISGMRCANIKGSCSGNVGGSAKKTSWQGVPSAGVDTGGGGSYDQSIAVVYPDASGETSIIGLRFNPEDDYEYFVIENSTEGGSFPYLNYAGYIYFKNVNEQVRWKGHFKVMGILGKKSDHGYGYGTGEQLQYYELRYKVGDDGSWCDWFLENFHQVNQSTPPGWNQFCIMNPTVTIDVAAGSLGGKYFLIDTVNGDYYIWFDVDNGSSDPSVSDRTGVEVDIASTDTASQIATKLATAIDGMSDLDAPFDDCKEMTYITCVGDTAKSLNGKYFLISDTSTDYYVWYDVDNTGSDPSPGGTGIEVDISEDDPAEDVAEATATAVDGEAGFDAYHIWKQVVIQPASAGAANSSPGAGDSGFTVSVRQEGYDDRVPIGGGYDLTDGDTGLTLDEPLKDGSNHARTDGAWFEWRLTRFSGSTSTWTGRVEDEFYNDPDQLYPGVTKTVTLENVVVGSRYAIINTTTDEVLANDVASSSTVEEVIEYPGTPFQITVRVRKATTGTLYKPYETYATCGTDGASVYVVQVEDE